MLVVDDAGGARVGPAVLGQPRTLELGADVGVTGLDKYGVTGPRLGLLAGRRDLVDAIRARAIELGLEARPMLLPAADPQPRAVPARTRARARRDHAGARRRARAAARSGVVTRTPFTLKLRGARTSSRPPAPTTDLVPVEATAALAMQLLRDHGLLTVHFAAVPPGTPDLLLKFVPPETLSSLGGAEALAAAIAGSFERTLDALGSGERLRELLYGAALTRAGSG